MREPPLVSVVTVVWNHSHLVKGFLESLARVLPPEWGARTEAVVVDNGSVDDTAETLERWRRDPGAPGLKRVLRHNENLGFAGGNNRGLREARGAHVLLVNNDVVFDGNPLEACVAAAQDEPRALFGGKLVERPGVWNRLHGRAVTYLEGWCLFARGGVFRELGIWDGGAYRGVFDESFHPAFYEDVDLGLRARLQGVLLRELRLPLRHLGSRTTRMTPGFPYMEILRRNQQAFQAKWAHLRAEDLGAPSRAERVAQLTSAVMAGLLTRRSEG